LQLPTRQWSELLPSAEFAYNNTLSAILALHPSLPTRVIIKPYIHPDVTLLPHAHMTCPQLDELHHNFNSHILKLNVDTSSRCFQTSSGPEFKIGSQAYVKAQFFRMTQPSKKLAEKFLDCTKSLHDPAPIPSRYDFQTVSVL